MSVTWFRYDVLVYRDGTVSLDRSFKTISQDASRYAAGLKEPAWVVIADRSSRGWYRVQYRNHAAKQMRFGECASQKRLNTGTMTTPTMMHCGSGASLTKTST